MRLVCSYCRAEMGTKEPLDDDSVSHTMCKPCYEHFWRQWDGLALGEYLDDFAFPVMAVNADRRMVAANHLMAELLQAPERRLEGLLGGEAMECVYARSPEGCGNAVHCETCTVRITVQDTHATGRAHKGVPAKLTRASGEVDLVISTEKRGDVVLVLIESIGPSAESVPSA